jgi:hypothetical protein
MLLVLLGKCLGVVILTIFFLKFFAVLGLELRAYTLSHPTSPYL